MNWKEGTKYKTKGGHPAMFIDFDSEGDYTFYTYHNSEYNYTDKDGIKLSDMYEDVLPEEYVEPKEIVGYVNIYDGSLQPTMWPSKADALINLNPFTKKIDTLKITYIEGQEPKIERVG